MAVCKPFPLASLGRGAVLLAAQLSWPSPPCQGQAASGRFASLDTAATARGTAAIEEDGEDQDTAISAGRTVNRWAISGPLTPVTSGLSRSLADTPSRRSGRVTGLDGTASQADSAGSISVTRSKGLGPGQSRFGASAPRSTDSCC